MECGGSFYRLNSPRLPPYACRHEHPLIHPPGIFEDLHAGRRQSAAGGAAGFLGPGGRPGSGNWALRWSGRRLEHTPNRAGVAEDKILQAGRRLSPARPPRRKSGRRNITCRTRTFTTTTRWTDGGQPGHRCRVCGHAERAARGTRHQGGESGQACVLEKPMEVSPEKCRQMIDACKQAGRQLAVGYRLHFDPPTWSAPGWRARKFLAG